MGQLPAAEAVAAAVVVDSSGQAALEEVVVGNLAACTSVSHSLVLAGGGLAEEEGVHMLLERTVDGNHNFADTD